MIGLPPIRPRHATSSIYVMWLYRPGKIRQRIWTRTGTSYRMVLLGGSGNGGVRSPRAGADTPHESTFPIALRYRKDVWRRTVGHCQPRGGVDEPWGGGDVPRLLEA